jgi:hypothetical protein
MLCSSHPYWRVSSGRRGGDWKAQIFCRGYSLRYPGCRADLAFDIDNRCANLVSECRVKGDFFRFPLRFCKLVDILNGFGQNPAEKLDFGHNPLSSMSHWTPVYHRPDLHRFFTLDITLPWLRYRYRVSPEGRDAFGGSRNGNRPAARATRER